MGSTSDPRARFVAATCPTNVDASSAWTSRTVGSTETAVVPRSPATIVDPYATSRAITTTSVRCPADDTSHATANAPSATIATPATRSAGRRRPRGPTNPAGRSSVASRWPFSFCFSLVVVIAPPASRAAPYSCVTSTCTSPMRTLAVDCRVTLSEPEAPPPLHVTSHVVVAVTGYASPGCPADDFS